MKNTINILIAVAAIILLASFGVKIDKEFIGTYGVSASDPAQIKLIINSDNTFYYQDFSVPNKKIIIHGNWTLRGNKVVLKNSGAEKHFHSVWRFAKDGQVAKSRKGFTFYRLGKKDH